MLMLNKILPKITKEKKRFKNTGNNGLNARSGARIKQPNYLKMYPKYGMKSLAQKKGYKIHSITLQNILDSILRLDQKGEKVENIDTAYIYSMFNIKKNRKYKVIGVCDIPAPIKINKIECHSISHGSKQFLQSLKIEVKII